MTHDYSARERGHQHAVDGLLRSQFGRRKNRSGERAVMHLRHMLSEEIVEGDTGTSTESISAVVEYSRRSVSSHKGDVHARMRRGISARHRYYMKPFIFHRHTSPIIWYVSAALFAFCIIIGLSFVSDKHVRKNLEAQAIDGSATILHANGTSESLSAGAEITFGDMIKTNSSGSVTAAYSDGTTIKTTGSTEWLSEDTADHKQLRLLSGAVSAHVAKQLPGAPFIIGSNDAEITVVGTVLSCSYQKRSRITVSEGVVSVKRACDGELATIKAGQETIIPIDGPLLVTKIGQSSPMREMSPVVSQGKGCGLLGHYYNNENFTDLIFNRIDLVIDFYLTTDEKIDPRIDLETYSIRWTGFVETIQGGKYMFRTTSNDGVRLWVNEKMIIDNWNMHSSWKDAEIYLDGGRRYPITIEYFQHKGNAALSVYWKFPGRQFCLIPTSQLYSE